MSEDLVKRIGEDLAKKIASFTPTIETRRVGTVLTVADGVTKISGLPHAAYLERLEFANGVSAVAINLEEDTIGAIILGDYLTISEGDEVRATGELLSVPVGDSFLGRVINPLGEPLDGKGSISPTGSRPLENIAPGVTKRQPVNTSLQTGIKAIDAMIPIGRGQR